MIIPIYCVSIPHRRSTSFFTNYSHHTPSDSDAKFSLLPKQRVQKVTQEKKGRGIKELYGLQSYLIAIILRVSKTKKKRAPGQLGHRIPYAIADKNGSAIVPTDGFHTIGWIALIINIEIESKSISLRSHESSSHMIAQPFFFQKSLRSCGNWAQQ